MKHDDQLLTQECVEMLVRSMTVNGSQPLNELQAERFINSLARLQSNVPTGAVRPLDVSEKPSDNNFIKEG